MVAVYLPIYNGSWNGNWFENTPAEILNGKARYMVENIASLFSLLRYDLSITTLPKLFFSNKPELAWIALLYPSLNRQTGVFKRANKYIPPPFQAFYELCIDYGKNHYLI